MELKSRLDLSHLQERNHHALNCEEADNNKDIVNASTASSLRNTKSSDDELIALGPNDYY